MSKHTPTPWDNSGDGKKIVHFYDNHLHTIAEVSGQTEHGWARKANAAHIVKCVNEHEDLVEANNNLKDRLGIAYEGMAVALKFLRALQASTGSLAAMSAAENLSEALSKARGEA